MTTTAHQGAGATARPFRLPGGEKHPYLPSRISGRGGAVCRAAAGKGTTMKLRRLLVSGLLAGSLLATLGGGVGAAPNENASEVGHCSSMFAQMQLRDDVGKFIQEFTDHRPGAFYSQVAKNKGGAGCQ